MNKATPKNRRLLLALLGMAAAWAVLHLVIYGLWSRAGGFFLIGLPTKEGPDLSALTILPWLATISLILAGRLRQSRPGIFAYFQTLPRCLVLYGLTFLVAAVLEQALDFHFVPSIGIHAALATLLLAGCLGGERRPFRHLRFDQKPRAWADIVALGLLILAYVEFSWDAEIWDLGIDEIGNPVWWLLQTTLTGLYVLLAWALLHSRALSGLGWVLGRWERVAAQDEASGRRVSILKVWLSHVMAASTILIVARLLGGWIQDLSVRGAWIFPHDGPFVALGVDWYFVTLTEILRAAEVAIPWILALVLFPRLMETRAVTRVSASPDSEVSKRAIPLKRAGMKIER